MPDPRVDIDDGQSDLPIDSNQVAPIVEAVLSLEDQTADEVSIRFVDEPTICALHAEHFDDPSPTDCISFPMDEEGSSYRVLGEVVVCPLAAIKYGGDPYGETTLYLVHGLLHLMGYDDIEESDRAKMRAAEERHLAHLETKGLLLRP